MKKLKLSIFSILASAACSFGQTSITWSSDLANGIGSGPDLVDRTGATVLLSDGWLMQMYTTSDGIMDPDFLTGGTDLAVDQGASIFVASVADGAFEENLGRHDGNGTLSDIQGLDVFSVLFNASTFGAATWYAILDDSPFAVPDYVELAPGVVTYNAGGVVQEDWNLVVAIPEPSTYAMILFGGGLLAYRRKRRS